MFAVITFEREPVALTWDTFVSSLNSWTQVAGGFAMLGLVIWLIARVLSRSSSTAVNLLTRTGIGALFVVLFGPIGALLLFWYLSRNKDAVATLRFDAPGERRSIATTVLFIGSVVWAGFGYLLLLALYLPEIMRSIRGADITEIISARPDWRYALKGILWTVAGAWAIFAVLLPILADLGQLSPRRIWAIARLSFKDAVRRKVLWVSLALFLVVLFGSWFIPNKPEDQVRTYVTVTFVAVAFLMLIAASLIAAFGIPDDIRQQTIHTVLTKPVQRFEIFLGRFLGYAVLMTAALVVVSGLGLLYVLRNIDPEAQEESLKAREPFYGKLTFQGTKDKEKGENVGREWEYRGYVIGKPRNSTDPVQFAVWNFPQVPQTLLDRDQARLEFALDIYRTHKGVEGQGIFCTFFVESWRFDADDPAMMQKYSNRKKELQAQGEADVTGRLAEELGFFELPSMEIKDYHTQYIDVPRGIFKNAQGQDKPREDDLRRRQAWPAAPFRVRIRCDSQAQFLGMATYDLYYRLDQDDPTGAGNKARFCVNFFKGSFGLWLRLCLMLGVAVAVSTYLSGIITVLTVWILYGLGFFQEFITEVALNKNPGGGPVEAAMRLLRRPGGESLAVPLEESTATQVSGWADDSFTWTLRRLLNVIPDVAQYSFTDFVAEGVSISGGHMAWSLWLLIRYLLPWAVLAYYLLKWREVASST